MRLDTENKCSCGANGLEPHTCPYKDEINDDSETPCNCCDKCIQDCADGI